MNKIIDHTKAVPSTSSKVIKSSLWGIAANGLQSILLSLFFVILAREYNKGEFATFLIANNIYQLLAAFSTLGLGQWFTRELIKTTNAQGLINKFLKVQLYSGVFFYLVNLALAWVLYHDVTILKIAVILGVNVVFDNFIYAIRSLNIAQFRQQKTFIILLVDSAFKFIASCILFIYPISIITLSIVLIAFRFITLNLFINYGTSKTVNIFQLIKHKISLEEVKKLLTQNWAFIIIGSVSILYWRIGNTIISKMLTDADVANYEVSYRIFSLALILPMIVSTTVFPQFVSLSKEENKLPLYQYFHKVFQLFMLYSLLSFTFMYSFAQYIIPFVFGQEYSNNVIHSIQMFLAVLVFPTVLLQANILVALHQEKKDMWLNIIALVTNVILSVVGILYFKSLDGVNMAIFFSFLLFHLLQDFLLFKMGITSVFRIVKFYLIMIVVIVGYALLSKYISPLWLYPSFVMVAGLIILNATVGFRAVATIFKKKLVS